MQVARGVTANGTVYAWQEIVIGPEVGGYRVAAVNVDVGDRVRKGQELVRLAEDLLAAEVASKRANLEQAQATLENAAAAYRRAQSLSGSGALSQSDIDKLRSEELAARARVEVSKAELQGADLRLRHTRVTAPDDGVISARSVNVGQVAQVGSEMLRLLRKGRVEWRAEIPESRMREIEHRPEREAHDGRRRAARRQGARGGADDREQHARRARLRRHSFRPAPRVPACSRAARSCWRRARRSMVPLASVVIQDGYSYVFVVKRRADWSQRRRVETGAVRGEQIEIVSGVAAGERIVDKGAGFLKDGDRVQRRAGRRPTARDQASMNFVTWSIRNPVPVIVLFVALTRRGAAELSRSSACRTGRTSSCPPSSSRSPIRACRPRSSRSEVTRKIEDAVATVAGIEHIHSIVNEGVSTTSIEFRFERDISEAVDDVRDAVTRIRADLPADAREPVISRVTTAGSPVVTFSVASPNMSDTELSWFVDLTVMRELTA